MALRIDEQVIRGVINNRTRGKVTGHLWIVGHDEPIELNLEGDAWRDIAGHVLEFTNPNPVPGDIASFARIQKGVVGDITASRKARVPDCPISEIGKYYKTGVPMPWHWGNCLYLEWFSERNGRVVIESPHFELKIDTEPSWTMSPEEEKDRHAANQEAMTGFMDRMVRMLAEDEEPDEDAPRSQAEADADAEAARMDLLLDRVQARLKREGREDIDFGTIYKEERERMRRERGEPDPESLTPEEEAERAAWIEEINAESEKMLEEMETSGWKDEETEHPVVVQCRELSLRLRLEAEAAGWVREDDPEEHPMQELLFGVVFAATKLAGALNIYDDEEWPPDPLFAGDTLVRLKKGRSHLRDAIAALDAADEQNLATPQWRAAARTALDPLLDAVGGLIEEVRGILE